MNCPNCGARVAPGSGRCVKCGTYVEQQAPPQQQQQQYQQPPQDQQYQPVSQPDSIYSTRSKVTAGILGILLGGFGVHQFYLGNNSKGGLMLGLQIVGIATSCIVVGWFISCGVGIWGLVEGIQILIGTINRDADGKLLKD
jgi:TM2 domain-containing membrane protein YozV